MPQLTVRNLVKEFPRGRGWWARPDVVRAVDSVSFTVEPGETFGLVGESGSGKTTTGRCILRLVEPTSGEVRFQDRDVLALSREQLRAHGATCRSSSRTPTPSLNPRMRARKIVEEPLAIHRLGTRAERRDRVEELFRLVGLDPAHLDRYPHEFSGGQRQRIGLARALALSPSLVIADEPVSGARRVGPGAGRQPAHGPPGSVEADLPVHRPRPAARGARLRPRRRDVPRQDPGDGADGARSSVPRRTPTRGRCSRPSRSPTRTAGPRESNGTRRQSTWGAPLREVDEGHWAAV